MVAAILGLALCVVLASPPAARAESFEPPLREGRQILVVIAVGRYEHWTPLAGSVRDARGIRDVVVERYHIDEVHELYDAEATKAAVIRLLAGLQERVRPEDSLLILYCGHGHLDRSSGLGFWIPVNAGIDPYEQHNWLPHTQVRGLLGNIRARHLCVISDSCFAGDLLQTTRSMPVIAEGDYFRKAYARVSRQVITSGATELVPDESDFARQLESVLRDNANPYLDTLTLYNEVRLGVTATIPLLGALAGTGHEEGGSYILFLKEPLWQAPPLAGALAVDSQRAGAVYVDGELRGRTGSGPVQVTGLASGDHRIRLVFEDGGYREQGVVLREGTAHSVFFGEGEAGQTLREAAAPPRGNRLSTGAWVSLAVPLFASARAIGPGLCLLPQLSYDFARERSDIGVGLAAGVMPLYSSLHNYNLLCLPVAVQLRYRRLLGPLPFVALEVGAGAALSRARFPDEPTPSVVSLKPLLAPSLSVGLPLGRRLQFCAGASFLFVFFDETPLTAISPGVRLEYALSTSSDSGTRRP